MGVILYVAGWLLFPADGQDTAPVDDLFGDTVASGRARCGSRSSSLACVAAFALFGSLTPFGIGPALVIA